MIKVDTTSSGLPSEVCQATCEADSTCVAWQTYADDDDVLACATVTISATEDDSLANTTTGTCSFE